MVTDGETPQCPYCSVALLTIPKRKSRCPHCKKDIYIRPKQSVFGRTMMTEQEAEAAEHLIHLQVSAPEYDSRRKQLAAQFNAEPKPMDVVWRLLNERVERVTSLVELAGLHARMADIVYAEGKDPTEFQRLEHRAILTSYFEYRRDFPSVMVEILAGCMEQAGETGIGIQCVQLCAACLALHKKTTSIEEALSEMLLPVSSCTCSAFGDERGFCNCCYSIAL